MKIEKISDTDYKIYVYKNDLNYEDVVDSIKNIIKKLQKRLKINGFYKVYTYYREFGLFLHLVKVDDSYYKDTLDLRIILDDPSDIYFKSEDYFVVKDLLLVRYFNNEYYGLVGDSFDNLFEKIEFGDFVFGCDTIDVINSYNLI